MYMLRTSASFDSAHFLSGYVGKCSNIHGHRWTIEAEICGSSLIDDGQCRGMVIDFGDLKKAVRLLADSFDHALLYETNTLRPKTLEALTEEGFKLIELPFRPTAENLSKHFYDALKEKGLNMRRITVYETPENCAVYEED